MLRITGGSLRGRRFATPKGRATRPTQEKARQGMFNVLAHLTPLDGAVVWDLFAGSGAFGIEALSRGAVRVVFVESHGPTAAGIRANLAQLGLPAESWQVVTQRAERWLAAPLAGPAPTLVLLDPPYGAGLAEQALGQIAAAPGLSAGCLITLECAAREGVPQPRGLELLRVKRYGDTQILFLEKPAESLPQAKGEGP